jgi:phage/plasmid-associated DNA primase
MEILMKVLGQSCCGPVEITAITGRDVKGNNDSLAKLVQRRIPFADETAKATVINITKMKRITGCEMGEYKTIYSAPALFRHVCKLFIPTNYSLKLDQDAAADLNRPFPVYCFAKYVKSQKDYDNATKLLAEGRAEFLKIYWADPDFKESFTESDCEACLKWLVQGSVLWYANRLSSIKEPKQKPSVIKDIVDQSDDDLFVQFINSRLDITLNNEWDKIKHAEVIEKLRATGSFSHMTQKDITSKLDKLLTDLGVIKTRSHEHSAYFYRGLKWKPTPPSAFNKAMGVNEAEEED